MFFDDKTMQPLDQDLDLLLGLLFTIDDDAHSAGHKYGGLLGKITFPAGLQQDDSHFPVFLQSVLDELLVSGLNNTKG